MATTKEVEAPSSSDETTKEHPLENEWVIWEHHESTKSGTNASYHQNMKELYSFKTVEQFWRFWNNYPKPSEIFYDGSSKKTITREGESKGNCVEALSIFKRGIKPEWEDEKNKSGGEWNLRKISDPELLDKLFENCLLGMVGETLDDGDDVNGLRVVDKSKGRKRQYRLELWIKSSDPEVKSTTRSRIQSSASDGMTRPPASTFFWRPHSH